MDESGNESVVSHERVVVKTKERDLEDDVFCYIHLLAVLMACCCFKRALVLMVFLLEEWRAWVFLFLNLVLLAILFASTLSKTTSNESKEHERVRDIKKVDQVSNNNKKIMFKSQSCSKLRSEPIVVSQNEGTNDDDRDDQVISCREDVTMEAPRLSREELNERAEAFIVMFRQHLVLDARKSVGKSTLV